MSRLAPAIALARRLRDSVGLFKVGSQLFTAEGPPAVRKLAVVAPAIFLDLKFHDIPNTVAGAVAAASDLPGVRMMTIHAAGGPEMMRAARRAVGERNNRPKLLGVTVLTSLDARELRRVGVAGSPATRAVQLAQLAKEAGFDGVVASARETQTIRRACGKGFLIVVPGVRPALRGISSGERPEDRRVDDQVRVATPAEAIRAGADYIVVGRPITGALNPVAVARSILDEIAGAFRR